MQWKMIDRHYWHKWFAWRPVKLEGNVGDTYHKWVWLQEIERTRFIGLYHTWWIYRLLEKEEIKSC